MPPLDLARKYSVGYFEIQEANPKVDMWLPGQQGSTIPGRFIVPPVDHKGIVINLPQHRLFYFPKAGRHDQPIVITYPVSPGEGDFPTPVGVTRIVRKAPAPCLDPDRAHPQGARGGRRSDSEGVGSGTRQPDGGAGAGDDAQPR